MPTRHKKSGFMSAVTFLLIIGVGIFIGALMASPPYRADVRARFEEIKPVRYTKEWLTEKKTNLALALHSGKSEPGLRRNQQR